MAGGRRAQVHGVNVVGLRRAGIDAETRARIQHAQRILYRSDLTTTDALAVLREDDSAETRELVAFVEDSRRGITSFGPAPRELEV
jgi:UDP-N-acetylglucosamine acyltransferase